MILRALLGLVLALAGCTTTTSGQSATTFDDAAIYAAVLGGSHNEPPNGRAVYVYDKFCTGMINVASRGACNAGTIPVELQGRIRAITGPQVRFTSRPPGPSMDTPSMRIGTITMSRGRALVATDYFCGPLCGMGQTDIVEWDSHEWHVTGTTGMAWIS